MPHESRMTPERWRHLMSAWGFDANQVTFNELTAGYSEKGRYYHTGEHVSACLEHLDNCNLELPSSKEIEIALWFHDVVYKPFSGSNEKDSADWAAKFLSECGASSEQSSRVHQLIMVTEHNAPTKTADEAILVDVDLSILGAVTSVYKMFEDAVRKEYRLVPSFIYRKKRVEILSGFLDRPKIYTSGIFQDDVEERARSNLSNAIRRLQLRPRFNLR